MNDQETSLAIDTGTAALFEQQQRELNKYQTRYLFVPFQDVAEPRIPGQYVPAGVIHPIPAPKAKVNVKLLPEGAQVLQVVSPSIGIPDTNVSRLSHDDPVVAQLLARINQLEQQAQDRQREPPNVAVYLLEVAPIIHAITSIYGREGAIEVTALAGTPVPAFERHQMNTVLFGPEASRPATALAIRDRMRQTIKQANGQRGEAGRILTQIAGEIIASVDRCETFCREHIRQRHLEMEDPQNDAPKRYSRRDLRALDFTGQPRKYEYMERQAEEQREQAKAAAEREQKLIEMMQQRDERLANVMADIAKLVGTQTEVLKTISANQKQ